MLARHCPAAIALAIILTALGVAWADQPGRLTGIAKLTEPVIRVPMSGDALLTKRLSLDLSQGANRVSFAFGKLGLSLDNIQLRLISPADGVWLAGTAILPDARDTVEWELGAREATRAEFLLSFPLKGIDWRAEYEAIVHSDAEELEVSGRLVLTNNSKLEFDSARLQLPCAGELTTRLRQAEPFSVRLFDSVRVPYRRTFVHDPAKYGSSTACVLELLRNGDHPFNSMAVPAGKVSIYAPGTPDTYIGEDSFAYLPPRETADLRLGSLPSVTVTRKVASTTQVELNKDIRNKLVLFHKDENVEFEVKNLRTTPVVLYIREKVSDDWKIAEHSVPFEQIDADAVQFVVNMQADETRKITYKIRRHNLQP